ncbi:MAG: glycan-binding surface protein [Adhaeribacter sp.]
MKYKFKLWLFLLVTLVMGGMATSCTDEDELENSGTPLVSYVRVTRAAASDSLIVKAGQNQMIAIMGQNLGKAREIWINDRQATLVPTFITNTSIITRVPAELPMEITNKMRIIFENGHVLEHPFQVDISKPVVSYMLSEYVATGSIATIRGNYFYAPTKVVFTGGVEGVIETLEDNRILVKVPDGAQPGPITVTTNFGSTESNFWFRDNRNIILGFDGSTGGLWTGAANIKDADTGIMPINNKFLRMNQKIGEWGWYELYVGPTESDVRLETRNIPAGAFTNPKGYSLKFEINTLELFSGAQFLMHMGPGNMGSDRNSKRYIYKPNIDTQKQWETVTIPWEEFWIANGRFAYTPTGYGVSLFFSGPNAFTGNFAMDNIRVVPN